jgi:hypothetical protein
MRWLALVALAGCGGIPFDELRDANLDALCDFAVRCGQFPDAAACRAYYEQRLIISPSLEAAIDAGKIEYDEDAAEDCLAAIADASCDPSARSARIPAEACSDVYSGTGGMGAACAFDEECASDNCMVPPCQMACCLGTCGARIPTVAVGQSCANAGCGHEAFCDIVDDLCKALKPTGATCMVGDECDFGLACVTMPTTMVATCKALPALGEPCPDGECASIAAHCRGGTCVPIGLPGDPCTTAADCANAYDCRNGACAEYPTRGMPCMLQCSDDSWCNAGTCDAPKPNGAACTRQAECENACIDMVCGDLPVCI